MSFSLKHLVCGLTFAVAFQASAETPLGLDIAAVVNDQAISTLDVENRMRFMVASTRLSNTKEVKERLFPQVVRTLIDEKLQVQEAVKEGVEITEQELAQAIASIEQQRGMPSGSVQLMLERNKVPKQSFEEQIRAQLVWNKLVNKKLRSQVKVTDQEVELAQPRFVIPPQMKVNELKISVFSLPVDRPSREPQVRQLAEKLVFETRNGANFEEVARQFAGGSIRSGGAFWIRPKQLDPVILKAIGNPRPGSVSSPLRNAEGYTIVKVVDVKGESMPEDNDLEVLMKEILLKLKADATPKEADVMLKIGEEVAKNPGKCEDKNIADLENVKDFEIDVSMKKERLSALPQAVRIVAETLKEGESSSPFATNDGIRLYVLCSKKPAGPKQLDKEKVRNILIGERLDLEAQKYLRSLRREAFIEVR